MMKTYTNKKLIFITIYHFTTVTVYYVHWSVLIQTKTVWDFCTLLKDSAVQHKVSEFRIIYTQKQSSKIFLFSGGMLRRALIKTFKRATGNNSLINLNEPVVVDICMTCDLFQTLATTFTQLRMSIVAGKSFFFYKKSCSVSTFSSI